MATNLYELNIREFDMNMIGDNKVIVFIGKRHTGKSVLVLDYLFHNQDIPMGTCISPTDEYNKTFGGKLPEIFIHEEFTPELLEKFIHRQKVISKRVKSDPDYQGIDNRAFLVFDDCLADAKSWINNKDIRFIFMNGRHIGVTFLLTMQYLLGIPPNLRANVDYIFICKETKTNLKKKLYEYYAGMFPNYDMFNQVLEECTKDFGCMVIDNTTTSSRLEDQVYWYKANYSRLRKGFKMCDPLFWNAPIRDEIYDQEEQNEFEKYDQRAPKYGIKSKSNLNVHRISNVTHQFGRGGRRNNQFNPELLYR